MVPCCARPTVRPCGRWGRWCGCGPDPETLAERVGSGYGRPLLANGGGGPAGAAGPGTVATPLDVLARLDATRRPLYEQVADVVVDVDGFAAHDVARRVVEALDAHAGQRAGAAGGAPG